ncbi:MAG: hypothetical protein M1815_002726 [Lichina confinis]|nr:MAG: hypothetical protein M1815_002726 [Lichina confinis]
MAAPITGKDSLNWRLLIELLSCGILTILFLFYFNRLFARLLSYALRAYTWKRYNAHVEIQSLQISLLAGRVFFRGFRYHGENETVVIHSGHITWRYWYRRVRDCARDLKCANDLSAESCSAAAGDSDQRENGGVRVSANLPCRLLLKTRGLEWFIYNRTPAYDAIIDSVYRGSEPKADPAQDPANVDQGLESPSSTEKPSLETKHPANGVGDGSLTGAASATNQPELAASPKDKDESGLGHQAGAADAPSGTDSPSAHSESSDEAGKTLLQLLPISLECEKGAITFGNDSIACLLIVQFERASGEIDASACPPPDCYRQIVNLQLKHPVISMRPNPTYKAPSVAEPHAIVTSGAQIPTPQAADTGRSPDDDEALKARKFLRRWVRPFAGALQRSRGGSKLKRRGRASSFQAAENRWLGLSRYVDENDNGEHDGWRSVEYAKQSTVLDSPGVTISYYWDVAGLVPQCGDTPALQGRLSGPRTRHQPPQWGVDLIVDGGTISYGPWTDRRRSELQSMFFPRIFKDSTPYRTPEPGQRRIAPVFKVLIELRDTVTLRIPTREPSKDWKWSTDPETFRVSDEDARKNGKKSANKRNAHKSKSGPRTRPSGWLDVKIPTDSTVSYVLDMVASDDGYHTSLEVETPEAQISSSVNNGLLWTCKRMNISCDLSNPLKWNKVHDWAVRVAVHDAEVFFLREHVFLLSDLVADWGTGPLPDYHTFTPMRYLLDLQAFNFRLYLNVNDSNIINNPSALDDNTFLIVRGPRLGVDITIPLDRYRPDYMDVPIHVHGDSGGGIDLHTPPWKTQSTFLPSREIGTLKILSVTARYTVNARSSPDLTDSLFLHIRGLHTKVLLFGFLVRYFLKLKDNYFGEDIHFKTLEEHQSPKPDKTAAPGEASKVRGQHKKTNDLDVVLTLTAQDTSLMLPSALYSATESVRLDLASLALELRFTNYYMDLMVNLSPLSASLSRAGAENPLSPRQANRTQLFLDGLEIYGHRLFGLPPAEPTYMCNWDFHVGGISGECTTGFLKSLANGLRNFGFTFSDDENALPVADVEPIYDTTFVRARLQPINLWVLVDPGAVLLSVAESTVKFNDWATANVSSRLNATLPNILVVCATPEQTTARGSDGPLSSPEHLRLETSIGVTVFQTTKDSETDFGLQQQFVEEHDRPTARSPFLLRQGAHGDHLDQARSGGQPPSSMPLPSVPYPFLESGHGVSMLPSESVDSVIGRTATVSVDRGSTESETGSTDSGSVRIKRNASQAFSSPSNPGVLPGKGSSPSTGPSFRDFYDGRSGGHWLPEPRMWRPLATDAQGAAFSSLYLTPFSALDVLRPRQERGSALQWGTSPRVGPQEGPIAYSPKPEQSVSHTTVILQIGSGNNVLADRKGLATVSQMLQELLPGNSSELLDSLQTSVLSKATGFPDGGSIENSILSMQLKIPDASLGFTDDRSGAASNRKGDAVDQYSSQLHELSLCARLKTTSTSNEPPRQQSELMTLHVYLETIRLSVVNQHRSSVPTKYAVSGTIDEVVLWFHQDAKVAASIQLQDFQVTAATEEAAYIASLVDHVSAESKKVSAALSDQDRNRKEALRCFVRALIAEGSNVADPAALTRPSSVLRSAHHHLRLSDSWKIMTRLRQVFLGLPPEKQHTLVSDFEDPDKVPALRDSVLQGLQQWGNWDLADVSKSYLLQALFEDVDPSPKPSRTTANAKASFSAETLRVLLDHGAKQSQLEFRSPMISCNYTVSTNSSTPSTKSPFASSSVAIEAYTAEVNTTLHWKLCDAAKTLLDYWALDERRVAQPKIPPRKPKALTLWRPDYHVVMVLDTATAVVEGINFKSTSACRDLQATLTSSQVLGDGSPLMSLAIQLAALSSEVSSPSHGLISLSLLRPNVYFLDSQRKKSGETDYPSFVSADLEKVSFTAGEDLSCLTETIGSIIGEELAQVHSLVQPMMSVVSGDTLGRTKDSACPIQMSIALSLKSYSVSIALLPSLCYLVSGTTARCLVRSESKSRISVDIDFGKQLHQLVLHGDRGMKELSHIRLPPIQAHVASRNMSSAIIHHVHVSVGKFLIDAAMISKLLLTISRPEVLATIKEAATDVQLIQDRLHHTLVAQKKVHKLTSRTAKPVGYRVFLEFAGVGIHGSAPSQIDGFSCCIVEIDFGSVLLRASNQVSNSSIYLSTPEVQLDLKAISARLVRREGHLAQQCGNVLLDLHLRRSPQNDDAGVKLGLFTVRIGSIQVGIHAETPACLLIFSNYLRSSVKDLDLSREKKYLRRLRKFKPSRNPIKQHESDPDDNADANAAPWGAELAVEILHAQVSWHTEASPLDDASQAVQDLVLSCTRATLATRKEKAARLNIENLQLEMNQRSRDSHRRSPNSALLPEVIFNVAYVSTKQARRLVLQAAGRSLDLQLTSQCIGPAMAIQRSVLLAHKTIKMASLSRLEVPLPPETSKGAVLKRKRPISVYVDADFAGAVVHLQNAEDLSDWIGHGSSSPGSQRADERSPKSGQEKLKLATTLRSPGVALKLEYRDDFLNSASIDAEMKVDSSANVLYPTIVPIIRQLSSSIQEVMAESPGTEWGSAPESQTEKSSLESSIFKGDPTALLGRFRINVGLRIGKQDFSLSCEPLAELTVNAGFELVYITVTTVVPSEQNRFFAITAMLSGLEASIQHLYSRESTGRFALNNVLLSMMNSRHLHGISGISAMLKVSPAEAFVNARQVHDFLLFRDLWLPANPNEPAAPKKMSEPKEHQAYLIQRYQQVAAAAAFPWNAAVVFEELNVQLDLGRALGKSSLIVSDFWISSHKSSNWEQNLCFGFREVALSGSGRLSGLVNVRNCKVRTSIEWPAGDESICEVPLIQASVAFGHLRLKTAFDYQVFLVADCDGLSAFMYNVRNESTTKVDLLMGILEGERIQVFTTATCAAQMTALHQALVRLVQEKRAAYDAALLPFDKSLRRKPAKATSSGALPAAQQPASRKMAAPLSLNSNVVVSLKEVNVGVFPSTLFDNQVFKVEVSDAQAHFAVSAVGEKVQGKLGLTLGHLRVAVSALRRMKLPERTEQVVVVEVLQRAADSRDGTILRVPRVLATMRTWQALDSGVIEYMFKSAFEGKVDVGWNYARIGFIRNLWSSHSRALAQRLGKPYSQQQQQQPQPAVKLSGSSLPPPMATSLPSSPAVTPPFSPPEASMSSISHALTDPQPSLQNASSIVDGLSSLTSIPLLSSSSSSPSPPPSGKPQRQSQPATSHPAQPAQPSQQQQQQQPPKITAVIVNVPQSKYTYRALEPPVIETPQLRDMGEATPPLEWIGLHRERLPHLTHQFVIVPLLGVAREVEDAYEKILGSF